MSNSAQFWIEVDVPLGLDVRVFKKTAEGFLEMAYADEVNANGLERVRWYGTQLSSLPTNVTAYRQAA